VDPTTGPVAWLRVGAARLGQLLIVTVADVSLEFQPNAPAVSQARRFLRQALQDLLGDGGGSELADTLLLAANELATNAVLHARTEFVVRIAVDAACVRVEVTDGNSRVPQPCLAPVDATSGRGLAIVDGSGLQWGIDRHAGGKTVWLQAPRSGD
jgi:anti-sigma regulatory factor (Ser/Thr protein kinase)